MQILSLCSITPNVEQNNGKHKLLPHTYALSYAALCELIKAKSLKKFIVYWWLYFHFKFAVATNSIEMRNNEWKKNCLKEVSFFDVPTKTTTVNIRWKIVSIISTAGNILTIFTTLKQDKLSTLYYRMHQLPLTYSTEFSCVSVLSFVQICFGHAHHIHTPA